MANERPSAVRLYAPDHPALVLTVRRKVEAEREQQINNMLRTRLSFDDYNYRTGIIEGLRIALLLTDQSEQELMQRS